VSWIVFACLFGYVSLRCTLWVRGQVRLVLLRDQLPGGRSRGPGPLQPECRARAAAGRNFAGRVELMASTRTIATLLITDPDVPLGCVRDFRYRLAVARAWAAACAWVRTLEELADEDRVCLERAGYTPAGSSTTTRAARLRAHDGAGARARALRGRGGRSDLLARRGDGRGARAGRTGARPRVGRPYR
jgi:hypothetical protein